jgi:hypothetical protein
MFRPIAEFRPLLEDALMDYGLMIGVATLEASRRFPPNLETLKK